jgi:hypothetical protein
MKATKISDLNGSHRPCLSHFPNQAGVKAFSDEHVRVLADGAGRFALALDI